jgi:prevent-host-death family protein
VQVNILEAKNRLSQLIKASLAGEEVVIANRGKPMVRLVPADKDSHEAAQGSAERILAWLKDHRLPESARRSAQEIDADIEAERRSWD